MAWKNNGVQYQADYWWLTLSSGQSLTLGLSSTAFLPTLVLLPPSALHWSGSTLVSIDMTQAMIDTDGGGDGNARLTLTASQSGNWLIFAASSLTSAPSPACLTR